MTAPDDWPLCACCRRWPMASAGWGGRCDQRLGRTAPADGLDPRSYEAAVERAVVHEAECIVDRAASGPTPMQRWTRNLFEQLRPADSPETEES